MIKLIVITIILVLQSFPSFGNLIGKGLMCKCEQNCRKLNYTESANPIYHFLEFRTKFNDHIEGIDRYYHLENNKI